MSVPTWHNEPPEWSESDDRLTVVTGNETDFWRITYYDFVRDSGHFYGTEAAGDFTASVRFSGEYKALYDQAGLMIRLDERNWIKAGIEHTDGAPHLSVVVTRDVSDWSVRPVEGALDEVTLRLSRHGDAVRVEASIAGAPFQMLRLAYFPPNVSVRVGPMACSPQREGFVATFWNFTVGTAIDRELHADIPSE